MRRYLVPATAILFIALMFFGIGFYSGFRKNVVFDMIVKSARYLQPVEPVTQAPEKLLDMTDRALLDSTLLPLRRTDIQVSTTAGEPLPLLAVSPAEQDGTIVIGADGTLFRLPAEDCTDAGCVQQIGRLVRPDGTALDDIYDMLSVKTEGGREWFVSYGQEDRAGYNKAFVISRFTLPDGTDEERLHKVEPPLFESTSFSLRNGHAPRSAGGEMVYDPATDSLIVTIGDYSLNGISNTYSGPLPPSQSPDSDLGKTLRVSRTDGSSEIISMGHRNPQGLSISSRGEVIATEHGPKGGDEINLIEDGRNYGWPNVSMGAVYNTYSFPEKPLEAGQIHGGYTPPILAFLPSPGIGAVAHIEGFDPVWDGDLMVATLKARSLIRVRRWPGGNYAEQIYIGDRIRDLAFIGGALVLATDSGKIIRLRPVEELALARTETGLTTNLNALSECGACHNLNYPVSTADAPHLRDILGRSIASASDYTGYSAALQAMAGTPWDAAALESFLRAPQKFAPGTSMPDLQLSDTQIKELMSQLPLLR